MAKRETRVREIHEVIDHVASLTELSEKVEYLRSHDSIQLRLMLELGFIGPKAGWHPDAVKDGETVPFTLAEARSVPSTFRRAYKNVTYFLAEAGTDHVNAVRREKRCAQFLESIHPGDANMFVDIIEGKFVKKYSKIYEAINITWPRLFTAEHKPKGPGRPKKKVADE